MDAFIGKQMSLVTKFNIRYQGLLKEIDFETHALMLVNAISYGTETRVSPSGLFVPPNPVAYGFLRFRADEINELNIIAPENPLPADPAIIGGAAAEAPVLIPAAAAAFAAPAAAAAPVAAPRAAAPRRAPAAAPPAVPSAAPWSKGAVSGAAVVATGRTASDGSGSASAGGAGNGPSSRRPGPGPAYTAGSGGRGAAAAGRGGSRGGGRGGSHAGGSRDDLLNTALEPERGGGGGRGAARGGASASARGGARGGHHGAHAHAAAGADSNARAGDGAALLSRRTLGADREHRPAVVAGTYDFETANARFQKIHEAEAGGEAGSGAAAAGEGEIPSFALKSTAADADASGSGAAGEDGKAAGGAYRKDDFFDELTTEASHTRLRRDEERRLNMDTFGATGVSSGYRGRGHYHHRGGRGGRGGFSSGGHRGGRGGFGGDGYRRAFVHRDEDK